ncbi:MAG: ABC transporter permease [Candidatus Thorarchaeota archaeon]|nr:ABC transporter permease [Candidatus Thorarchaeota archaeon]
MNSRMYVISATVRKELRTLRRNKRKLFIVTLLPLLYYSSFFILMGGIYSSGISVALVVEESSPGYYTNGLIETLEEHDSIPPNLMIIRTDAETADSLFANGDVLVVVVIPDGFENSVANGSSAHIQVRVNNIHEDATKNLRMPIIRKVDLFYQKYLGDDASVDFTLSTTQEVSLPRLAYMSWTIAIFSIMFVSMYIAGSAVTNEFEAHTLDEITLSSAPVDSIFVGKILSGVISSYLVVPVLLLLGLVGFGVWPQGDLLIFLLLTLPLGLLSASIGALLGSLFKNSVYLVPLTAMLSLCYWILCGGIAPLLIVGIGSEPVNLFTPFFNVYRSLVAIFINGTSLTLVWDLAVIWVFALVLLGPLLWLAQRTFTTMHLLKR